jgi:hypothetical protein
MSTRRTLICAIADALLAVGLPGRAQTPGKVYRIGWLSSGPWAGTQPLEVFNPCNRRRLNLPSASSSCNPRRPRKKRWRRRRRPRRYTWVAAHYVWRDGWKLERGHWVAGSVRPMPSPYSEAPTVAPAPDARWVPGYWDYVGNDWDWKKGHWESR